MRLATFVLVQVLLPLVVGDECCWCGKRYYQGTPSLPHADYVDVNPVEGVVVLSKSFYLAEEQLEVMTFVHGDGSDTYKIDISADTEKATFALHQPSARINQTTIYRTSISMHLQPNTTTTVNWILSAPSRIIASGTLNLAVAPSIEFLNRIGAVRIVYRKQDSSRYLERFSEHTNGAQPFFPFGYYISWPLIQQDLTQINRTIGNILHPVSPFSGLDTVEIAVSASAAANFPWMYDMRHNTDNLTSITEQVLRFRENSGIMSWYIADEPDGAGNTEGLPIGMAPTVVEAAYRLIQQLDPYHPVSLVLNCKYSAPFYTGFTDILMVDPYPVGIKTDFCSDMYGCCGCDDCTGNVTDVSDRMDFVGSLISYSKPIHFVGQGFGDGQHWTGAPTSQQFRIMTYLGFMHNNEAGISYWIQGDNDYPLLQDAIVLYKQLSQLIPTTYSENSIATPIIPLLPSPNVHASAWFNPDTLLAVAVVCNVANETVSGVSVRFTNFTVLAAGVDVLFEEQPRMIEMLRGQFEDMVPLPPLGIRVYSVMVNDQRNMGDALLTTQAKQ